MLFLSEATLHLSFFQKKNKTPPTAHFNYSAPLRSSWLASPVLSPSRDSLSQQLAAAVGAACCSQESRKAAGFTALSAFLQSTLRFAPLLSLGV